MVGTKGLHKKGGGGSNRIRCILHLVRGNDEIGGEDGLGGEEL